MREETANPVYNCKRCPVMTVLEVEFDADFVRWMYFLAEQRQRRESGFKMDTMTRFEERSVMMIDAWVSRERDKQIKNMYGNAGKH